MLNQLFTLVSIAQMVATMWDQAAERRRKRAQDEREAARADDRDRRIAELEARLAKMEESR